MHSLPLFHRVTGQCVIVIGNNEAAAAKRRLVERAGGVVTDDPAAPAVLAFVAFDPPEDTVAALKARGLLVNVVDRPDLCDFTVPSLLERDAVLIAVGTGGVSAGLAKALRLRLEGLIPQTLGALAQALSDARTALRERWPEAAARRRGLDAGLSAGGTLDPLADYGDGAVEQWLRGAADSQGTVTEFSLTGDDADDLTLRQARLLGGADLVLHDPDVPPAILNRARADAVRQVLGKPAPGAAPGSNTVIIRRG